MRRARVSEELCNLVEGCDYTQAQAAADLQQEVAIVLGVGTLHTAWDAVVCTDGNGRAQRSGGLCALRALRRRRHRQVGEGTDPGARELEATDPGQPE